MPLRKFFLAGEGVRLILLKSQKTGDAMRRKCRQEGAAHRQAGGGKGGEGGEAGPRCPWRGWRKLAEPEPAAMGSPNWNGGAPG